MTFDIQGNLKSCLLFVFRFFSCEPRICSYRAGSAQKRNKKTPKLPQHRRSPPNKTSKRRNISNKNSKRWKTPLLREGKVFLKSTVLRKKQKRVHPGIGVSKFTNTSYRPKSYLSCTEWFKWNLFSIYHDLDELSGHSSKSMNFLLLRQKVVHNAPKVTSMPYNSPTDM